MEAIIVGVSIVLVALIIFMFMIITYVSIRVKNKIRIDNATLFTKTYLRESKVIQSNVIEIVQVDKKAELIHHVQEKKIINIQQKSYLDADFLEGYYAIKNHFQYSLDQIVKPFINHPIKDSDVIEILNNYLTYEKVYRLSLLEKDEQMKVLKEELNGEVNIYFMKLYGKENHDILNVYQAIKELNKRRIQGLQVRLSPYYSINERNEEIHYVVDDTLAEGFQIINDGRLYDYSIKRSELS